MPMTKIIKTMVPFSEDFIPTQLIDREIERNDIRFFLKPISEGGSQLYNLFVTGSVGVGKTLLSLFITRELPSRAFYIKLTGYDNTAPRIISKITIIVGSPSAYRGYSNLAFEDLIKHFNTVKLGTLLVFDDFDKVPLKAIEGVLHEIPRQTHWCNLLIISRVPTALEDLPTDTKSTLQCRELLLKPYNAQILHDILIQRIELALTKPNLISDKVLWMIANTAALSGSARRAIEMLKTACMIAERQGLSKIDEACVNYAFDEIDRRSLVETIKSLPEYHKLLLQCCDLYPQTYSKVYQKWKKRLNNKGLKALSIYRFRDFVADLKKLDLVQPTIKGMGRGRGFSYFLKLSRHVDDITGRIQR